MKKTWRIWKILIINNPFTVRESRARWTEGWRQVSPGGHSHSIVPIAYTFRFTRGEVVSSTTLWFISLKSSRGDGRIAARAFAASFFDSILQLHYRLHSTTTRGIVRSRFPLWPRILYEGFPFAERIHRKGHSKNRFRAAYWVRYLWQKWKRFVRLIVSYLYLRFCILYISFQHCIIVYEKYLNIFFINSKILFA